MIETMARLRDLSGGVMPTVHSYPDCTVYMADVDGLRVGVVVPRDDPAGYDVTVLPPVDHGARLAVCEKVIAAMEGVQA